MASAEIEIEKQQYQDGALDELMKMLGESETDVNAGKVKDVSDTFNVLRKRLQEM